MLVFYYILHILSQLEKMLFYKDGALAFFIPLLGLISFCSILLYFLQVHTRLKVNRGTFLFVVGRYQRGIPYNYNYFIRPRV
jgi:hypothetical protein